jgi:hypothetical protein
MEPVSALPPDEGDASFDPNTFPLPRKYSTFDPDPEIAKELDTRLNTAEREDTRLPALSKADISDSAVASPWARKLLLCLDGGGIKGFSSLLILKRLTDLIEEIETGVRKYNFVSITALKMIHMIDRVMNAKIDCQ